MADRCGNAGERQAQRAKQAEQPGPELLDPPGQAAEKQIREHLAAHGIRRARLDRYLYLGGPRSESQIISWEPGRAIYHCERCPERSFWTGEITDQMVQRRQMFDPVLQSRLPALDPQERDAMTRLAFSGELNRQELEAAAESAYRAESARRRPRVARRRAALQEWMLKRYAECGAVNKVIDDAEQLRHREPELWQALVGRPLAGSTIRKNYWNPIPTSAKRRARERFEQAAKSREV